MYADSIMHVDRLRIQHAMMEAEPSITVCGSRIKQFGDKKQENSAMQAAPPGGLIENPLLAFMRGNCMIHATAMMRKQFLNEHCLQYENCPDAEDFKLWAEIAMRGGQFYVDTQNLLYCPAINRQEDEKQGSPESIINGIVEFLAKDSPELSVILASFKKLKDKEMMTQQDIVGFFHHFFMKNKENPWSQEK